MPGIPGCHSPRSFVPSWIPLATSGRTHSHSEEAVLLVFVRIPTFAVIFSAKVIFYYDKSHLLALPGRADGEGAGCGRADEYRHGRSHNAITLTYIKEREKA